METRTHKKYIYFEFRLLILRFSFYCLGWKKVTMRCELSWGWDD